jgi:hypothetical protein
MHGIAFKYDGKKSGLKSGRESWMTMVASGRSVHLIDAFL